MEYAGTGENGEFKSLSEVKDKGQWQCNHKKNTILFQSQSFKPSVSDRGSRRSTWGIFFFIFVLFILILVALYQVGSRLRSRHVEFISEFYRWLAAEKSLVGGQWATSYDTNENFADLPNQAFMDHRANLIIRNPNKIKRRIDISRTVENDNLSYFNQSIRLMRP